MITAWTKHLKDQDAKANFERTVWGSKPTLDRLIDILKEELNNTEEQQISAKSFDSPNWAEHQAYMNGYKQAQKTIIKLINLDQQKHDITNRPS